MPVVTPRVLLLDVMGTLVHGPFFVEVPRFFGMSLEELVALKHPRAWLDFELGEIDEATLLQRFFADGREVDGPGLKRAMLEAYRLLPGIESLLHELYARSVPLHALSNYPRWYELVEERVRLSRYLRWSFVSCLIGMRKPDPGVFQHVSNELGVPASACLVIDDREDNCQAAREEGMDAIRFTDAATLRRELVGRGVL